jgi:Protein of unknown function (DUF2637)
MTTATPSTRITGLDRAVIVAMGSAGCALSYDALRQMAVAIHVRTPLTFLFPLVIDGFIGYGVRALLVMRAAPAAARAYVWVLFGTATATSIWANALHAVRLNQRQLAVEGVRLGDATVGVLSTVAPLALAGAVHLYILIARRATEAAVPVPLGQPAADRGAAASHPQGTATGQVAGNQRCADTSGSPGQARGWVTALPARAGHLARALSGRKHRTRTGFKLPDRPTSAAPLIFVEAFPRQHVTQSATSAPFTDPLMPIARRAAAESGKVTRAVVAAAIRGQGLSVSNARLTDLMRQLRAEAGHHGQSRAA